MRKEVVMEMCGLMSVDFDFSAICFCQLCYVFGYYLRDTTLLFTFFCSRRWRENGSKEWRELKSWVIMILTNCSSVCVSALVCVLFLS